MVSVVAKGAGGAEARRMCGGGGGKLGSGDRVGGLVVATAYPVSKCLVG